MSQNAMDAPEPGVEEEGFDISLVTLLNLAFRNRTLLITLPLVVSVVAVLVSLLMPSYKAEARFIPNGDESSASRLAGVAAQFGFTLPTSDEGESIDFYGQLLTSREILTAAIESVYRFETDTVTHDSLVGNFIELHGISGSSPQEIMSKAVTKLSGQISVGKDAASNVVTLDVTDKWPALTEQLNRRLLDLISDFNLKKRQSSAAAERIFVEGRLKEARAEMEAEEARLMAFLQDNRTYADAPRLKFEADRLQSRVDLRRQVYTTLAQSYEQSRIEEVRNTPVLTLLDRPEGSAQEDGSTLLRAIFGLLVGGFLALGIILGREYLRYEREKHPGEYHELERLATGTVSDLRSLPGRTLRRLTAPGGKSRDNGG